MAGGYRLTPEARTNLDDICAFVAEDSIDAALRLVDAFAHAFDQLAAMPGVGHTREDLTPRPVKFWRVYYLVVYDPASPPPTIVAILHGARDVERLLVGQPRRAAGDVLLARASVRQIETFCTGTQQNRPERTEAPGLTTGPTRTERNRPTHLHRSLDHVIGFESLPPSQ